MTFNFLYLVLLSVVALHVAFSFPAYCDSESAGDLEACEGSNPAYCAVQSNGDLKACTTEQAYCVVESAGDLRACKGSNRCAEQW